MLGHVYVVEDAKDLAQIVKDVARYGGAYRPEVCHFGAYCVEFGSNMDCRTSMSLFKDALTGRK